LIVRDYDQVEKHRVRAAYGYLEGWVSIVVNVLLFILKFTIGLFINSISLIADSFHTLADVLTSVIVVVGFWVSRRPADQEHPHGHGRFEIISTLAIAILLIVIGAEFFWSSVQRLIRPQPVTGTILVVVIILFSALVKEWLARFAIYLGKKIKASVLLADAWHHRSDAIASALVSVAIVAAMFGYVKIDSAFGILVSLLIAFTGYDLGRSAISFLMGEAPSEEILAKIERVARSVDGVRDTHKIMIHDYGNHQAISIHIQVDEEMTVHESHDIATKVQRKLAKSFESVSTEVHIEPQKQGTGASN
jgi:cation diffusion facilitator family transporter